MASVGRVLMLLENNSYVTDIRVRHEAQSLMRSGYQISVISPRTGHGKFREVIDGVHIYQYPGVSSGQGFLGYAWEYSYSMIAALVISVIVFADRGFDIVHAHNPPDTFFPIAAVYKLFGKRFVYDHHDLAPEMYRARFKHGSSQAAYWALVWMEKLTCRLADQVLATNGSYKVMEMERSGIPEDRITIVRNGPDLNRVQSTEPDRDLRLRADFILGYVGRLGPQDGVDHLLRALHHLHNDLGRDDFLAVIVGKGDVLAELKKLTEQLGIETYVWFTGWITDEDLIRYLSTADICVDPDPSNPFNDKSTMIKVMEYMALGKPIVAFDLPEHRVTAQEAAIYARANDDLDFARQISVLMDDPDRRKRMGEIGIQRIKEELAWIHQEGQLLDAYERLMQSRY